MALPMLVFLSLPGSAPAPAGDFSSGLLRATGVEASRKNELLSPYSAHAALSLTAEGTEGASRARMERLLKGQVGVVRGQHEAFVRGLKGDGALSVANSVWVKGTPDAGFARMAQASYGAEISPLTGVGPINAWVNRATRTMIPKLFDQLPPTAECVLVNAVAFQGKWATPFDKGATRKAAFTGPSGRKDVSMMSDERGMMFYSDGGRTWIRLDYKETDTVAWFGLPKATGETAGQLAASVTNGSLAGIDGKAQWEQVRLMLPKFRIEANYDLTQPLGQMVGAPLTSVSLSRIVAGRAPVIGAVVQRTFMKVDEQGTEAAAATGVIGVTSAPISQPKVVQFNRPFVVVLTKPGAPAPLFIGVVNEPKE